jgi:hypothetical protein
MAGQALRRSQFITTYGPGAILEGRLGPRVIPVLGSGLSTIFSDDGKRTMQDFEITDSRLSSALLGGANIIRLPSNAELNFSEARYIYETTPFPSWALCPHHQILYLKQPESSSPDNRACPQCGPLSPTEVWRTVRRQAIRFVMACPEGHLDDVNWSSMISHQNKPCQPAFLYWRGSGSALRNITIVCPDCGGLLNLGQAYSREWRCSGRFPERGIERPGCEAKAKMIQRGAANLRIPELYTSLTIPPADTRLHRILQSGTIRNLLEAGVVSAKEELLTALRNLVAKGRIGAGPGTELETFSEADVNQAIAQNRSEALPQDNRVLRLQEFKALRKAAIDGAPAMLSRTPGAPPQFEVVRQDVHEYIGPGKHPLRVTPVSRLRVVMVQKGYRRLDPLQGRVVDIAHIDENEGSKWYPGVELFGEGIFIDLAPSVDPHGYHFPLKYAENWLAAWHSPERYHQRIQQTDESDYLHPVFVWWHTFAHRLINALSIDSGYSSAAVRERVYIDIDDQSGRARGGILLYTVQPGGDGTLGGMMALAAQFDRVLRAALNTIDMCSNDPLCAEEEFDDRKYNGSACYACLLVSETSCEHRNTRLDRTLLKENLP